MLKSSLVYRFGALKGKTQEQLLFSFPASISACIQNPPHEYPKIPNVKQQKKYYHSTGPSLFSSKFTSCIQPSINENVGSPNELLRKQKRLIDFKRLGIELYPSNIDLDNVISIQESLNLLQQLDKEGKLIANNQDNKEIVVSVAGEVKRKDIFSSFMNDIPCFFLS